jgi:FAD dependent oxidoreductase
VAADPYAKRGSSRRLGLTDDEHDLDDSFRAARPAKVSRLRSSPRVAVIGAGVVGCTVAWRIREALGFDVDVYERRDNILLETSAGTSNRLHYGYQYALSAETATTLRDYYERFTMAYGPCIVPSTNYYGVADESLISPRQYLDFCARCELPLEPRRPAGIFTHHVLLSLLSVERSLDPDRLRELCRQKLQDHEVRVIFATATPPMLAAYDYVVSAVYGNPNLLHDDTRQQEYAFSLCEMIMVKLPDGHREISAMIVYGPFMTIDVLGATGCHVLYHGAHGIHHGNVGKFPDIPAVYQPLLYRYTPASDLHGLTKAPLALDAARRFFDCMPEARHIASNFVVRVQDPSHVRDAVRRTTIKEVQPGWYSIAASKLSACVSIADRMIGLLQERETGRWFPLGRRPNTAPSRGYPSRGLPAVAGARGGRL